MRLFSGKPKPSIDWSQVTKPGYYKALVGADGSIGLKPMDADSVRAVVNLTPYSNAVIDSGYAKRSLEQYTEEATLRQQMMPGDTDITTILQIIYRAFRRQPHIRRAVETVADFASAGFELRCESSAQKEFIDDVAFALDLDSFLSSMFVHLFLTDRVYLWWKYWDDGEDKPLTAPQGKYIPKWIAVLSPDIVKPFRANGKETLLLLPWRDPMLVKAAVTAKAMAVLTGSDSQTYHDLPKEVLEAAKKKRAISLDELKQYGYDYGTLYRYTKASWEADFTPAMYSILSDLVLIEMCIDIDFKTMSQTKAGILLFTWGPGAGQIDENNPPPSEAELTGVENKILKQLTNPMPYMVAGTDFQVRWIVPPGELYTVEKYHAAMGRVFDFLGIPSIFWPIGIAGIVERRAFASAYIEIKPFRQRIESLRRQVGRWVEKFLLYLSALERVGTSRVKAHFDPNVLVEDRIVLDKARFSVQQGIISQETAMDDLDYDFTYEMRKKTKELQQQKPLGLFEPYYAPARGIGAGPPRLTDQPREPSQEQPRPSQMSSEESEERDVAAEEIAANIELTRQFIAIPVVPADQRSRFIRYRRKWLSRKRGIQVLWGITSGGDMVMVTLYFLRSKFDLESARGWIDEHGM